MNPNALRFRTLRLAAVASLIAIFVVTLVSWIASYKIVHGVTLTSLRRYAIVIDSGVIQLRYGTKTDIMQNGAEAWRVEEVGFQSPDHPQTVKWGMNSPRLILPPWKFWNHAEYLAGGEVPEPRTGRTISFGEHVWAYGVPHWMLTTMLGVPLIWWIVRNRHRIESRRIAAGLCAKCGYDLRASPRECPECGATKGLPT